MTVNEILNRLTPEDIANAMTSFKTEPYQRKGIKGEYQLVYEQDVFPVRELIMRATNRELKDSENPDSYTTVVAKNKLIELGFTNFLDSLKMYTYYLKKASKQDVEKTTVINIEAVTQFFGVSLINKDDTATVTIHYLSDNTTDTSVQLLKKQDPRIFIDRTRFSEGDILLYISKGQSVFDLDVITNQDDRYQSYLSSLTHNYFLSDNLPIKNPSLVDLFDEDNNKESKTNEPLNQIIFGPPGTGKTYSTITKALDIIGVEYNNYEEAQKLFQKELGKRIEFVTMHQSFSYEDFVQGLKPLKSKDGENITFDYKNGVFKEICKRANLKNKEYKNFQTDNPKVDFDLVFEFAFRDLIENEEPVTIENGSAPFKIYELNDKTLWFETSKETRHTRYTLAKKTLKDIYKQGENTIITSGNKGYFDSVLSFLNKKAAELQEKLQKNLKLDDNKNLVIILDEINRANISRVFGELIALIEKDKRDGKLTVTLPSGEPFTVPSNLYIIGTMNTADKSIALVDIALRRRFEFTPLYPNPKILKQVLEEKGIKNINQRVELFANLNRIIRAKKSVDFEIGHSYFMEDSNLIDILNKQVLPLLNEYFMYDLKKVKDILCKQQKDREGNLIPNLNIALNKEVWRERGLLEIEALETVEAVEAVKNSQMAAEPAEKYTTK